MPVANHRARFGERRLASDTNQDDCGRGNRNRHRRMHGNAQRAVVGVALQRVHMRHLDDGEQSQQGQTHEHGRAESAWLPAVAAAQVRLKFCLQVHPCFKDTQYWTRSQHPEFQFLPDIREAATKKAGLSPTFFASYAMI
jgi:hypothetical protein